MIYTTDSLSSSRDAIATLVGGATGIEVPYLRELLEQYGPLTHEVDDLVSQLKSTKTEDLFSALFKSPEVATLVPLSIQETLRQPGGLARVQESLLSFNLLDSARQAVTHIIMDDGHGGRVLATPLKRDATLYAVLTPLGLTAVVPEAKLSEKYTPVAVREVPLPSSKYGVRVRHGSKKATMHHGVDYPLATGSPLYLPDGFEVVKSGSSRAGGQFLELRSNQGGVGVTLRHLSEVTGNTKSGIIAKSGNSGTSTTGPHLHLEVQVGGKTIDPTDLPSYGSIVQQLIFGNG